MLGRGGRAWAVVTRRSPPRHLLLDVDGQQQQTYGRGIACVWIPMGPRCLVIAPGQGNVQERACGGRECRPCGSAVWRAWPDACLGHGLLLPARPQVRQQAEEAFKAAQGELKRAEAEYKQRVRDAMPASLRK